MIAAWVVGRIMLAPAFDTHPRSPAPGAAAPSLPTLGHTEHFCNSRAADFARLAPAGPYPWLMTDSPLRYPAEIYAPFNEGDAARLRTYVRLVDDLVGSSFFEAAKDMSLTIGAEMEGPASEELTYPGEEAVRAVVAPFRQLYNHREPSSYDAVLNLLSDHVHDRESLRQAEAQEALRDLKKWKREALRFQGFAMNLNGWRPAPKDIIDLFFNGLYFTRITSKLGSWMAACRMLSCGSSS
jgi:hypothetical protein